MYHRANGNARAALRMYQKFPHRRMLDRRIFQRLHHQHCERGSFRVTRHEAGRRRAVRCSRLEEINCG